LLFPAYGFTTAAWDPPRRSSDVDQVGTTEITTVAFCAARVEEERPDSRVPGLIARYCEAGEILVYNDGDGKIPDSGRTYGFAICLRCGYAASEITIGKAGRIGLPAGFESHSALRDKTTRFSCWSDKTAPVLRNQTLAAIERTDVLMLDFSSYARMSEALATTVAYALRQAGARMLELDARELGALIIPSGEDGRSYAPVLFDGTPGGAGHTLELLKLCAELLDRTLEVLYVTEDHHAQCDTCCTDCILSFASQRAAMSGLLRRRDAHAFLAQLVSGVATQREPTVAPAPAPRAATPGNTARLERLLARRTRVNAD
jgi:hypothetical protein